MNQSIDLSNIKFLWTFQMSRNIFFSMAKGVIVSTDRSEVLQGTLDLLILKTLYALGPLHGFGVARRIEQVSEDVLKLRNPVAWASASSRRRFCSSAFSLGSRTVDCFLG
jgi:hypothetical protein